MAEGRGTGPNGRGALKVDVYDVDCGKCGEVAIVPTNQRPAEEARRMGWELTQKHGWICPRCSALKHGRSWY